MLETIWLYKKELDLISKCYEQTEWTNHIFDVYMYKEDLALNNLQWLICHKIQPNNRPTTGLIKLRIAIWNPAI